MSPLYYIHVTIFIYCYADSRVLDCKYDCTYYRHFLVCPIVVQQRVHVGQGPPGFKCCDICKLLLVVHALYSMGFEI